MSQARDKTQGLGCDLLRIALLDKHPFPCEQRKHMMKAISILLIGALAAINAGCLSTEHSASATEERYPWKKNIVTTVFWIGERPSGNNPVPNRRSSWDKDWTRNYGGFVDPKPAHPGKNIPVTIKPGQKPRFWCPPKNRTTGQGHSA